MVRGIIPIAMIIGRVCRVVVGEGTFIQRRPQWKNSRKKRVVVHEEFYCTIKSSETIHLYKNLKTRLYEIAFPP